MYHEVTRTRCDGEERSGYIGGACCGKMINTEYIKIERGSDISKFD